MNDYDDPHFRNVDFEIRSKHNLSELAAFFQDHVHIQYNGKWSKDDFLLSMAPKVSYRTASTPEKYSIQLLKIIDKLPPELLPQWGRSISRIFDFGFEGGVVPPPYDVDGGKKLNTYYSILSSKVLGKMALLKISIAFTIYPFYPEPNQAFNPDPAATI